MLESVNVSAKGPLGAHSAHKHSSVWVCSNRISHNNKDHQGQWKRKRVSYACDDVELDYVDAKVAAVLAPGGVCNCIVVDGCA